MSQVRKHRNPVAESLSDDRYRQRIVREVVRPSRAKMRSIERLVEREWIGSSITEYHDEEDTDHKEEEEHDNISPTL